MISKTRLQNQFDDMRQISAPSDKPGIFRLAFTDSDCQGHDYLINLMRNAHLKLRIDAFGNIIARRPGTDDTLPPVMFGSHADSVPSGGNYDGITGVLAAIEVMKSLDEDGIYTEHPLEAVIFMCEESSRFSAATLGSRAMCGELTVDDLYKLKDSNGISLYEVLKSRQLIPDKIDSAYYSTPLKAFFEVHIEQGKVLDTTGEQIGVVTGIAAPTRFRVHLHGHADHSGATPMEMRCDGSCSAAEIILLTEKLASSFTEPPVVGTVGVINISPCAMNVIPGEVTLGIDIRSISQEAKTKVAAELQTGISLICKKRKIAYDIEPISDELPVKICSSMIHFLSNICSEANVSWRLMPSGAGHDAMHWAKRVPTGMLFIPCKDGISHNPSESAKIDDIVTVTKLLEKTVLKAAKKETIF